MKGAIWFAKHLNRRVPSVQLRLYRRSSAVEARVLATDGVDERCINIFKERGHTVDLKKTMSEAELSKIIGDYDALVVRSATKVTPTVIKEAKKMRIIGRAGVGVDNIDVKDATKHGIMVMNTPGGNTVSTAQLAVSLLCCLARNLPAADMSIKEGKWDRKSFTGVELRGKTLGIVGCGRIGQEVARCAKEFGMTVIGYDPVLAASEGPADLQRVELAEIWRRSDFISVHTPLTAETKGLLNTDTLMQCKRGVRIINCARGGIIDEVALLQMLETGQVAGAALDVFTSEPPEEHLRPLLAHPHLVCTPHLGASTAEAQVNVARDIAVQMCDVFDQRDFVGVVNVPYLACSTQIHMKPFMRLAEQLGALHAQLSPSRITQVTLRTVGGRDVNITTRPARQLLEAQVLKGILKHSPPPARSDDSSGAEGPGGVAQIPDLINAPLLAKEAGIESIIISDAEPGKDSATRTLPAHPHNHHQKQLQQYWNLVTVQARREDGSSCTVAGVVLGNQPHIVQVDDFSEQFAFRPEGNFLLTFRNEDRPGAISEVLAVLQRAEVNIASMHVARPSSNPAAVAAPTPLALCFMALDDDVPASALSSLRALPFLKDVAKIALQ